MHLVVFSLFEEATLAHLKLTPRVIRYSIFIVVSLKFVYVLFLTVFQMFPRQSLQTAPPTLSSLLIEVKRQPK